MSLPSFAIDIEVRFRDLDAMGHVNNAVIFTYFEEGRKHFFTQHFSGGDPLAFNFILAHAECDYLLPIQLDDRPRLEMRVNKIGSKSFGIAYRLFNPDTPEKVFATGNSVQVCFDYSKNLSIPIPETMRTILSAHR